MNFKTIPKNGASWREPLLYEVELADDEQQVEVEIYDQITQRVIGSLRLYANGPTEVDIAPYIRSAVSSNGALPESTAAITTSTDAFMIKLRANGMTTQQRLYFREDISNRSSQLLSSRVEGATIANGEIVRLTVYANEIITLTFLQPANAGGVKNYTFYTQGIPCEIAVPISNVGIGENLVVRVRCDGGESVVHNFKVVQREESARRLAWINGYGGVECHTFPQSIQRHLMVKSEEVESELGWYRRVVEARLLRRMLLHGATQSEIDRTLGILLSPVIYLCDGDEAQQVRLLTDSITFDDHGKLRKLEFDIEEVWKGGVSQCA